MKKLILLMICFVAVYLLSGCFYRSNVFKINLVPEEYSYYSEEEPIPLNDKYASIDYFSFSITPITKDEYMEATNINVMPDYSKKDTYYRILLSVRLEGKTGSSHDVTFLGQFINAPAYDFRSIINKYDPDIEIVFRLWPRSSERNGIADYFELQIKYVNGEDLGNTEMFKLRVIT